MKPAEDTHGPCLVLGYDRSESSRHAASWAASELPADGKLVLVYACRPLHAPPPPLSSSEQRERLGRAVIDELLLESDELLLESDDSLFDVDFVTEISDEDPVSALTHAARRHGARAIVVGSQQHSRLHKALGTVTSELLKSSPVPVTIVPSLATTAWADDLKESGGAT